MKIGGFVILTLLTICCSAQHDKIANNFNELAFSSFNKEYTYSNYWNSLPTEDQCILKKMLMPAYLDRLNNWSMSIIDSFYVRSYNGDADINYFSFIGTRDSKFYFIYSSEFNGYRFSYQVYDDNNRLKDSTGIYCVKLHMPIFDDFVRNEISSRGNLDSQVQHVEHLFTVVLQDMLVERYYSPDAFIETLRKRPKKQYEEIENKLKPILQKKVKVTGGAYDYAIYWNLMGFVIIDYRKNATDNNRLEVDFYFVPHQSRPLPIADDMKRLQFGDCY